MGNAGKKCFLYIIFPMSITTLPPLDLERLYQFHEDSKKQREKCLLEIRSGSEYLQAVSKLPPSSTTYIIRCIDGDLELNEDLFEALTLDTEILAYQREIEGITVLSWKRETVNKLIKTIYFEELNEPKPAFDIEVLLLANYIHCWGFILVVDDLFSKKEDLDKALKLNKDCLKLPWEISKYAFMGKFAEYFGRQYAATSDAEKLDLIEKFNSHKVISLSIANIKTPRSFELLTSIKFLRYIDFGRSTKLSDKDLAFLPPNLQGLNLYGCKGITNLGLTKLPLKIKWLNLAYTKIEDWVIAHVPRSVNNFSIEGCTKITQLGIFQLRTSINHLSIRGLKLGEESFVHLSSLQLKLLDISGVNNITTGLPLLSIVTLSTLYISPGQLSKDVVAQLTERKVNIVT
jgi:hypothetical protein